MARIARLAGALLLETQGRYFLVGNPKGPCDLAAAGFAPTDGPIDAMVKRWFELDPRGPIRLAAPVLEYGVDGTAAVVRIAEQLLIPRNASVSDRLWRLVVGITDDDDDVPEVVDATWLANAPERVWSIVRDAVLRCS
jgi:hypothetical protein